MASSIIDGEPLASDFCAAVLLWFELVWLAKRVAGVASASCCAVWLTGMCGACLAGVGRPTMATHACLPYPRRCTHACTSTRARSAIGRATCAASSIPPAHCRPRLSVQAAQLCATTWRVCALQCVLPNRRPSLTLISQAHATAITTATAAAAVSSIRTGNAMSLLSRPSLAGSAGRRYRPVV